MMKIFREFVLPTSILAGTIIGAGIFSLPYVFSQSGLGLGYLFLILFGLVYAVVHTMYADIVIKNGDEHRFVGLAKIYFGRFGYWLSVLMTIVEMIFVLAIYLVLSVSFLSLVFPGIPVVYQMVIFWWIASLIIFSGTKKIAFFETLAVIGILAVIAIIAWLGLNNFFNKPFVLISSSWNFWLLPFGALLFSINGRPAIPTVTHYFKKNGFPEEKSKWSIIWGTLIPVIAYGFFVAGALGVSSVVTADTVTGIANSIPSPVLILILAILGILSLISSYFTIGLDVFRSLELDLNFSRKFSMFLVIAVPLIIYFMNLGNFITLVEIAGGIFIGLEGILIVAMWNKMKKGLAQAGIVRPGLIHFKSNLVIYGLYTIFGISIAYVIFENFIRNFI